MSFGPYEVQKTVYSVLTADTALMALITGVFDNVPDKQAFPFVVIGENTWADRGSHTTEGLTGTLTIHVWERERGRKNTLLIQKRIDELLHKSDPIITDWHIVNFRRELSEVLVDPDNITYHGIQRFNLLIGGCS